MRRERKIISVPVSPDLKSGLDTLAGAENRPTANYIRLLLEKHVEERRRKTPAVFERQPVAEAARS